MLACSAGAVETAPAAVVAPTAAAPGGVWGALHAALSWIPSLGVWTAFGSLIVWLGGKAYEEFAARLTQRRTFVQETTKKVVDLAWTHYWGLANAAGTLGGTLQAYLRTVEAHLLLRYRSPDTMQQRFAELAADAARVSWPTLIRLIMLFHRFQFRGSNTYLLPNHQSGETLRRLYNRVVAELPQDTFVADIRVEIERALAARSAEKKDDLDHIDLLLEDEDLVKKLEKPRAAWERWLADGLARVDAVAEASEAFEVLVTKELVQLNAAFFQDRSSTGVGSAAADPATFVVPSAASAWAAKRWPGLLEQRHLLAIERAQFLPRSFSALGARKPPIKAPLPAQVPSSQPVLDGGDGTATGPTGVRGAAA